eukprot:TRINITY_DN9738_c0_g1_i1.p1 TRINITY_DN9738_c0_g1~~TRINITY_DN9738_c0_g1_i1.p1  ORF type:complete len:243 (-),score=19.44 TRINITY_DN9738_c0_g1_i1:43-723(-)
MARETEKPAKRKKTHSSSSLSDQKTDTKRSSYSPRKQPSDDRNATPQLIFSDQDEINLLNAFLDFTTASKSVPTLSSFLARLNASLTAHPNRTQISEKLRDLRHKYEKQRIDTPHDRKVFEICAKIWGKKYGRTVNAETLIKDVGSDLGVKYGVLIEEVSRLPCNAVLRKGLGVLEDSKLWILNERWRLLRSSEMEVRAKRFELIKELIELIMEGVGSSPAVTNRN